MKKSKRKIKKNFCRKISWHLLLASTAFFLHLLIYYKLHELAFTAERIVIQRPPLVWSNKYNLVHVVHSRFMQHQGNLTHLGRARLELFKSFCLPTLQHQSTREFLWILSVDPNLDADLKSELLQLVQDVPNAVVLAQNSYPEGFRNATLDSIPLWSGSIELLKNYQRASQRHALLETQLDADDGLHSVYLEGIQQNVNQTMGDINSESWRVYCVFDYIEWQFFSLPKSNQGLLTPFREERCPTPGLTWAYSIKAGPHNRSIDHARQHMSINERTPKCSREPQNCVQVIRATDRIPFWAIRSRTPTSHGTHQLLVPNITEHRIDELAKHQHHQEDLWEKVANMFSIQANDVGHSRQKIHADFKNVLQDALKGRCTQDNSCKWVTEELLQTLLNNVESENEKT